MIDCSYIIVSMAINDSLTNKPIFMENRDPVKEFVAELNHRQGIISREVWKMHPMVDKKSLLKRVRERWIN